MGTSNPQAARSEMYLCIDFLPWVSGSNPDKGMVIRLLCLFFFSIYQPLRRAGHTFGVVLPSMSVSVCDRGTSTKGHPIHECGCNTTEE